MFIPCNRREHLDKNVSQTRRWRHLYEPIEHQQRHDRQKKQRQVEGDDTNGGDDVERAPNERVDGARQHRVDDVNIFSEAIHQATDRCRVKEHHRRTQWRAQHAQVQATWRSDVTDCAKYVRS